MKRDAGLLQAGERERERDNLSSDGNVGRCSFRLKFMFCVFAGGGSKTDILQMHGNWQTGHIS